MATPASVHYAGGVASVGPVRSLGERGGGSPKRSSTSEKRTSMLEMLELHNSIFPKCEERNSTPEERNSTLENHNSTLEERTSTSKDS